MTRRLKIGILGTRGIPNRYGGFEQFAEFLAQALSGRGHDVWVYNSERHEFQGDTWNGIHIVHRPDPQERLGTAGQFLYDLRCINDARRRDFDVCLQLGYTSSSLWHRRWPRRAANVVNMDGLEWKRAKYNRWVRLFLRRAERWAAVNADELIADSPTIQFRLADQYGRRAHYIPYGASVFDAPDEKALKAFGLTPFGYHMIIARLEPENHIDLVIRGCLSGRPEKPLLIVGRTETRYGARLRRSFGAAPGVRFLGGIFDRTALDNLRYFSHLYFHGHSVGGTNPSLLEAMGGRALIAAHDNVFNRSVLDEDAFYFSDEAQIADILRSVQSKAEYAGFLDRNSAKIRAQYSEDRIVDLYESVFLQAASG
jgi:glycosyltransferase involved in cell wall biosynthesis